MLIFILLVGVLTVNPGIKFEYPQSTLTYMVNQIFPWVQKQIQGVKLDDIHQKVKTPIGSVNFDLTNGKISKIAISTPTFKIISANQIQIHIADLLVEGGAHWHYKEKSFPHLSDSGSIDLKDIQIECTIEFGAVIDTTHKSHIKITNTNFAMSWKKFDVKIHGGASWLYNLLIKNFKHDIEKSIEKVIKSEVPKAVIDLMQPMIDKMDFEYPIGIGDIEFSYLMESIAFDTSKQLMAFGVDGFFKQKKTNPPGQPKAMGAVACSQMLQLFVSQFALSSSVWAGAKAGLLTYVIQDSSELPIHLTTESFSLFLPELPKKYPNKNMQVTLNVDPENYPNFIVNTTEYIAQGPFTAKFQVINSTTEIIDAFTLEIDSSFNATIYFKQGKQPYEYTLSLQLGLQSFKAKLVQSTVGQFNPDFLSELMTSFIEFFVLPNLNKYYLQGIPIPSSEYFKLKNPKLTPQDGFFVASLDFDFYPPSDE